MNIQKALAIAWLVILAGVFVFYTPIEVLQMLGAMIAVVTVILTTCYALAVLFSKP